MGAAFIVPTDDRVARASGALYAAHSRDSSVIIHVGGPEGAGG